MNMKLHDLSKILKRYSSKWVALNPQTTNVVAVGDSPQIVIEAARKSGVESPVLTRVPKDYGTYIL